MTNPLRDYMTHSLELVFRHRAGEKLLDELPPVTAAIRQLSELERAAADARIERAIAEILNDAPAPAPVVMLPDFRNLAEYEADNIARELVAANRRLIQLGIAPWRREVGDAVEQEYNALKERRLAERKAAREAADEQRAAERVEKLEAELRVKALETEPAPTVSASSVEAIAPLWRGFWTAGSAHPANTLIGHKHGLWISERPTVEEPGNGDSGWRLIVRRPR